MHNYVRLNKCIFSTHWKKQTWFLLVGKHPMANSMPILTEKPLRKHFLQTLYKEGQPHQVFAMHGIASFELWMPEHLENTFLEYTLIQGSPQRVFVGRPALYYFLLPCIPLAAPFLIPFFFLSTALRQKLKITTKQKTKNNNSKIGRGFPMGS